MAEDCLATDIRKEAALSVKDLKLDPEIKEKTVEDQAFLTKSSGSETNLVMEKLEKLEKDLKKLNTNSQAKIKVKPADLGFAFTGRKGKTTGRISLIDLYSPWSHYVKEMLNEIVHHYDNWGPEEMFCFSCKENQNI